MTPTDPEVRRDRRVVFGVFGVMVAAAAVTLVLSSQPASTTMPDLPDVAATPTVVPTRTPAAVDQGGLPVFAGSVAGASGADAVAAGPDDVAIDLSDGAVWHPLVAYPAGSVVTHDGRSYRSTATVVGVVPDDAGAVGVPLGFAADVRGGAGGRQVEVTTLADSGPGSLRAALSGEGPTWVTFAVSGELQIRDALNVPSRTTVDGRGADITITGRGLHLREADDVIITNLKFSGSLGKNDDAVRVTDNSTRVWLDHLDVTGILDEGFEISRGATDVTLSWVRVHDQGKSMLLGTDVDHQTSTAPISRVTVHHTVFERTEQRNPRAVRRAMVHVVNSVLTDWIDVGAQSASGAQMVLERNVIEAGRTRSRALVTRPGQGVKNPDEGSAVSRGDWYVGDPELDLRGRDVVFGERDFYDFPAMIAGPELRDYVQALAGWQDVPLQPWTLVEAPG